ncbi:MAG: enoyl-CoA hydratase-related protein [Acidobacteriota bacterium]
MDSVINISDLGAVRVIELNRPEKRNALNDELIAALKQALLAADADESLRAVIIRGAGKDFCSGADLSALQKIAAASHEENLEDAKSLAAVFAMIRTMDIPVIAAVHGRALAGGCGLATACDLVVATRSARFGYPEVKIGFVPAIVMTYLRRNVSEKRAFELATRGAEFSAAAAFEMGLVNRIFDENGFDEAVVEYASAYESVSRSAVAMSKDLLYRIDGMDFDAAIDAGSEVNAKARMSEDCRKGIAKFLDKT